MFRSLYHYRRALMMQWASSQIISLGYTLVDNWHLRRYMHFTLALYGGLCIALFLFYKPQTLESDHLMGDKEETQ